MSSNVGATDVIVANPLSTTVAVTLVCPTSEVPLGPYPPTILSVGQANQRNPDGSSSSVLAFGVVQAKITGSEPVAQLKLYRGPTDEGPFTFACDDEPISPVVVVNNLFDSAPTFGVQEFYVATAIDSTGLESGFSNVVTYTASIVTLGLVPGSFSAAARGPYPVLGCDCYLDPTTGEGVIGPNGDLLSVNGLECLAQDLRIRILTEFGELPMHPTFGLGKALIIGSGQAQRQAQAAIMVANIKDMLRQEPRVYKVLDVTITQYDQFSWIIGYDIMAINVEDVLRLNTVYPFYLLAQSA